MTTIWIKNEEITAFCDNEAEFDFPPEYGEKRQISESVVMIAGRIYIADSAEAVAAQKEYDDMFKSEGGDRENVVA